MEALMLDMREQCCDAAQVGYGDGADSSERRSDLAEPPHALALSH
jgi:hypothetical protein